MIRVIAEALLGVSILGTLKELERLSTMVVDIDSPDCRDMAFLTVLSS